jgi:YesN/AraC family two-component response regulator
MSRNLKILYVDDEPVNLHLFEYNFKKSFYVHTAESGLEGLEIIKKNIDIEVVISDIRMPHMNGLDFIQKAKELYPDKKFYILTGFDISNEIQNALDSNLIQAYFQKPFNKVQIEEAITKAFNEE